MLADLRFMLGAVLAVAVLAVAGLGLATSVQLMRAAHMEPLADSRSLAYAGPTARNAFYDPETARRFAGEKIAAPQPEPATPVAPLPAPKQTASLPADPPAAAPAVGEEKEIPTAPTTEAPAAPAPLEAAVPPASPPAAEPALQRPVAAARVASAPVAPPPTESPAAAQAPIPMPPSAPQVTPSADSKPPPQPKPAFKKRIARHHRALARTTTQQPENSFFGYRRFPNSQFPTASTSWPSYNNNFWGAPKRTR